MMTVFAQGSTYNVATHCMNIALWVARCHWPFRADNDEVDDDDNKNDDNEDGVVGDEEDEAPNTDDEIDPSVQVSHSNIITV